jgi:hypothetical protein
MNNLFLTESSLPFLTTEYEQAVEEIQKHYETITNTFNAEVDAVRAETHYKWVQQLLSETDDEESVSTTGEEL